MSDKYSKMFAEYSYGLKYEDVPPESAHEVKRRILDSIGVSMAAFSEDAPKAARTYAYDFKQARGATVWGAPVRVTPSPLTSRCRCTAAPAISRPRRPSVTIATRR